MQDIYNILEIRKLYGLSQTDFARKARMSRELVSKIENGKCELKSPTLKKLKRFLDHHPLDTYSQDVNILGKASQPAAKMGAEPYMQQRMAQKNEPQLLLVPMVGIKAQAGYVKGYAYADYMDTLERYSLPPGVNPMGAVWSYFEVEGDSMEPTFGAGDIILASMLPHEDWREVKSTCVYIILTEEQLLVKRVHPKNEKEWVLISDNDDLYPQVMLDVACIKQVWTFRRHIRSRVPQPKEFKISA